MTAGGFGPLTSGPPPASGTTVDAAVWAASLGISREAAELYLASDVIDLHVDSFIWVRIFGYDLGRRHGRGLFGGRFYSQVDFPRLLDARITGATWIITTNPFRTALGRERAFFANLERLSGILQNDNMRAVRTAAEYRAARAAGLHGAFIGVQGGNALDHDLSAFDRLPDRSVLRITLVHLSSSRIGVTSSPLRMFRSNQGLSPFGRDYVKTLNDKKIFVDLAHISRPGFFDAVEVHDRSQPLIVTHTGVCGVHPHWRNLDDNQLKAIADTGGVIGVIYETRFLGDGMSGRAETVVRHLEHIVRTVGADHAALGSDWDGSIITPRDMPTCSELPRLVHIMLERRWKPDDVQKVLGKNFLRAVEMLRG